MLVLKEIPELVSRARFAEVSQPGRVSGSDELSAQLGSWISKVVFVDFILGGAVMSELLVFLGFGIAVLAAASLWNHRRKRQLDLHSHTISPEALHRLLITAEKPNVLDFRVPLDFLAHAETIPGARRITPSEILANPQMISKESEYVLYCTCPGEHSTQTVLETALRLGFFRVKMLSGGIEAWKQKGFPVEEYRLPFHLDVP
jgi:rhodanese-related sulfurtransferase